MKQIVIGLLLIIALSVSAQDSSSAGTVRVPNVATGGKRQIDYEEPLTASLRDGVWSVYGTLCCPDRDGKRNCEALCVGGVAKVQIRQEDGKVLSVTHRAGTSCG